MNEPIAIQLAWAFERLELKNLGPDEMLAERKRLTEIITNRESDKS